MADLQTEIVKLYKKTDSIKATAREMEISEQKVRKMLIMAGAYSSDRAEQIRQLIDEGLSAAGISERLKISLAAANSYMPYTRQPITPWTKEAPRTANAQRIHASRLKAK